MRKILTISLIVPLALLLVGAAWWWQQQQALPLPTQVLTVPESPCPAPGVCLASADFGEVRLIFPNIIKVMEEFSLEIQSSTPFYAGVLDFTMLGMEMGQQRYELVVESDGKSAGAKVLLPICVSQRSDWQLRLQLTLTNGAIWQVDFPLLLEH